MDKTLVPNVSIVRRFHCIPSPSLCPSISNVREHSHHYLFALPHHTPQHTDIPYSTSTPTTSCLLPSHSLKRRKTLFALPTSHIHRHRTYREYTTHTYHYYSTPTHTESYDFLPPSEPLFEKTTNFTECLDILLESGDGYEYTETFSVLLTATSDYKINASQNTTQITILDSDSECLVHVDYLQGV